MKFSLDISLTTSKICAILILVIGSVYSFMFKDSNIIGSAMLLCAGLLGFKTGAEAFVSTRLGNTNAVDDSTTVVNEVASGSNSTIAPVQNKSYEGEK